MHAPLPPHAPHHVLGVGPGGYAAHAGGVPRPRYLTLHLVYCVLLGLTYVALLAGGIAYFFVRDQIPFHEMPADAALQLDMMATVFAALSGPLAIVFLAAPFLPRKPWAWTVHLILCCIGLTSACCLPFCIPVMIQWLKPETKAWFGKPPT